MRRAILPKVVPPRAGRVIRRARVSQALLGAGAGGAVWVQAPGGWGKTTAVAALAEDLKRPIVWLHLDAGDSDPLGFFHFLRLATIRALPKSERALPVFAKELEGEAALFARRFARAALESAPADGATLVFDNLQDIPDNSAVHAFLAALADELTPAWRVFLVTRREPGLAYAGLRGQGRLERVVAAALAFTEPELKEALRERGLLDETRLEALGRRSGGWIAGALLLAMQGQDAAGEPSASDDQGAVFDYFAAQALARRPEADRRLLVRTAFLTTVTPEAAERLATLADAGARLESLAAEGVFTTRLSAQPARYRYHDLFRQYLRREAEEGHPGELEALRRASAAELLSMGDALAALELLAECAAWEDFAAAATQGARDLLRRGQFRRFAQLMRGMPATAFDADPWLRYWLGQCELLMNDDEAALELARAHDAFERRGERAGQLLAAIEMPIGVRNRSGSWKEEALWTQRVEALADAAEALVPADLSLKAYSGLLSVVRQSPALERRTEEFALRVFELIPRVDDPNLRLQSLTRVVLAAWRTRRPALGPPAIGLAAELDLERGASPLIVLHWLFDAITFDSIYGDPARALANAERAEALAKTIGLETAVADSLYLRLEVACDMNDLPAAHAFHARLGAKLDPRRPIARMSFEGFAGRIALLEGDGEGAIEATTRVREVMRFNGGDSRRILSIAMVEVSALALLGRYEAATLRGRELADGLFPYDALAIETTLAWARAAEAVDRGEEAARATLAAAVATARSRHDFHPLRHANALAARLCARALDWDIEPDFIRAIVARRRLRPPDLATAAWPWALRVHCLGRFDVRRGDESVVEKGRAQKSLELLQLAIALGGNQVPIERFVKTLWPGEGREGAQQAFDTTVHRLRKLLDADDAIQVSDRRVSIDRRHVWVDSFALADRLDAVEEAGAKVDVEALRRLTDLYGGHFLPHRATEPWAAEARERLWGRTRRVLHAAARNARANGDDAQAERILYFIADLDPMSEETIALIMRLHAERGQPAEALRAYRRCEAALAAELRIEPGAELRALAASIRR